MSDENLNNSEENFTDFANISDIDLNSDVAAFDEEAIEKALKNIVSQMQNSNEEYNQQDFNESVLSDEADSTLSQDEQFIEETIDDVLVENSQEKEADEVIEEDSIENEIEEIPEATEKPEIEEKAANIDIKEEVKEETQEEVQEIQEEIFETKQEIDQEQQYDDISGPDFDELDKNSDVVKKYIVYVSKDFVPYIDNMSTDERSAYINDAIQQKIDLQDTKKQAREKRKIFAHIIIAIAIIITLTPFALLLSFRSIMLTFENYKYSQENFEKLYKHRFEEDKAYLRSLEYNQEYERKLKKAKQEQKKQQEQKN